MSRDFVICPKDAQHLDCCPIYKLNFMLFKVLSHKYQHFDALSPQSVIQLTSNSLTNEWLKVHCAVHHPPHIHRSRPLFLFLFSE